MPTVNSLIILLFLVVLVTGITLFIVGKICEAKNCDVSTVVRYQAIALTIIYILTLLVLTLIGREVRDEGFIFLIPFSDIYFIIKNGYPWYVDNIIALDLINAALFVPLGFLLREVMNGKKLIPIILGIGISVVIEVIQLITALGVFDINDIIWNTFGILIGYGIYALYKELWRRFIGKNEKE